MKSATLVDSVMDTWAPDTRHYVTDDGQHFAIHVYDGIDAQTSQYIDETLAEMGMPVLADGSNTIVVSPTTVNVCTKDGLPIGDSIPEPLHTFDPGTSHVDALALMGYTITS